MKRRLILLLAGTCVLVSAQGPGQGQGPPEIIHHSMNPHGAGAPTAGSAGSISPNIRYHGGPVMGTPTPYLIWYGNWKQTNGSDTPAGQQIVRDFVFGLGGSNYYKTNATYSGVSGNLGPAQETTVGYTHGTTLSDNLIATIVSEAIANGLGGTGGDANGIYLVLTSSDVNESSGFCTQYCGWHTYGTLGSKAIKYAFVGNANRCLNACAAQTVSPNGNAGVDGMVSVIAHETEETNTDPQLNAWFNSRGAEDADMCAWTFGQNLSVLNGAYFNMSLFNSSGVLKNYLVQRELASDSKCYVDYPNRKQ
jgi:hypothetical protein